MGFQTKVTRGALVQRTRFIKKIYKECKRKLKGNQFTGIARALKTIR